LFARNLSEFHTITRKATRVIRYQGDTRIIAEREHVERRGYANGFENLLNVVDLFLPSGEVIGTAARRTTPTYPPLAVREVLANALIHQDLSVTGAGPIVEVFDNRVEITNPGLPLVSTPRLLDSPPRSRNESLASLMRRIGYCEERGGGVDKVVFETEFHQLPAPIFEEAGDNFRVVLFGPRSAGRMDKADRVRACYWHACLKYVNRDYLTNSSIRERFAISSENNSVASRYIREAVQAGEIKPFDEAAAPRLRKYVPYWATSSS
jgi:predicted HTH transcriptional regulator